MDVVGAFNCPSMVVEALESAFASVGSYALEVVEPDTAEHAAAVVCYCADSTLAELDLVKHRALVALTTDSCVDAFARALQRGARGVAHLDMSSQQIVWATIAAAQGVAILPHPAATTLAAHWLHQRSAPHLSEHERALLVSLTAGRTAAQIADECSYSERTIRRHLARLFDKLGAGNRADAIARAHALDTPQLAPSSQPRPRPSTSGMSLYRAAETQPT